MKNTSCSKIIKITYTDFSSLHQRNVPLHCTNANFSITFLSFCVSHMVSVAFSCNIYAWNAGNNYGLTRNLFRFDYNERHLP